MEITRSNPKRVLVVEDQQTLRESLHRGLKDEGYSVLTAGTSLDGYILARRELPDVMILDLLLPDGNGLGILNRLRNEQYCKPILIVTACDAIEDRIVGLNSGADDYLVKPFAFGELVARVKALLRRFPDPSSTIVSVYDLTIDRVARKAFRAGMQIELTTRQFDVLEYLVRNQNTVVSRETLAAEVWRAKTASWTNVIEVQINQLRKRIERPEWRPILHTVRREGYLIGDRP